MVCSMVGLTLTHTSRLLIKPPNPKRPRLASPNCLCVCLLGPSGTPRTTWPSRREGTQGEC